MNRPTQKEIPMAKLIPNMITIFGICVGLTALRFALLGNITMALYLLILAMVLDALDGKVARSMNSQSPIGAELDTLADFFNFGIATPLILFVTLFQTSDIPNLGWLSVLTLAVCCAFRLARFNVSISEEPIADKPSAHFTGVPAPALACLSLSPLYLEMLDVDVAANYALPAAIFLMFTSFLAVATFPTVSLKQLKIPSNMQYVVVFAIAVLIMCLLVFPWQTLLVGNALYLINLPLYVRKHT